MKRTARQWEILAALLWIVAGACNSVVTPDNHPNPSQAELIGTWVQLTRSQCTPSIRAIVFMS